MHHATHPSRSAATRRAKPHVPPPSASADTVMAMNRAAMSLLQRGDMSSSDARLREALAMAEHGARRFLDGRTLPDEASRREAWLLALAATLSNLGCHRRRDGALAEARRFLEDARGVEERLFGKPSCSTMVNLSAVLLGLGEAEAARGMARDCVAAAADGDPLLRVIALHNYGVTLSQHASGEARGEAAPVLMRALREAEAHLGASHPTTALIRQRCGLLAAPAETAIAIPVAHTVQAAGGLRVGSPMESLEAKKEARTHHEGRKGAAGPPVKPVKPVKPAAKVAKGFGASADSGPSRPVAPRPLPPIEPNSQEMARMAIQSLDYGTPIWPLHAESIQPSFASSSLPSEKVTRLAPLAVAQTGLGAANTGRTGLPPHHVSEAQTAVPTEGVKDAAAVGTDGWGQETSHSSPRRASVNRQVSTRAEFLSAISLNSRSSRDAPPGLSTILIEEVQASEKTPPGSTKSGSSNNNHNNSSSTSAKKNASSSHMSKLSFDSIEGGRLAPGAILHPHKGSGKETEKSASQIDSKNITRDTESHVMSEKDVKEDVNVWHSTCSVVPFSSHLLVKARSLGENSATRSYGTKSSVNKTSASFTERNPLLVSSEISSSQSRSILRQLEKKGQKGGNNPSKASNVGEGPATPSHSPVRGAFFQMVPPSETHEPSFLRFAPPLPRPATPKEGQEEQQEQQQDRRSYSSISISFTDDKLFPRRPRETGSNRTSLTEAALFNSDKTFPGGVKSISASAATRVSKAFSKNIGLSPVVRREQRVQQERAEEAALRSRRRAEAAERAKEEHFVRTLAAIRARTQDRAARRIQSAWLYWWNSVGRRRRELLRRRAEDRARRERSRLALLEHERRLEEARRVKKATALAAATLPHHVVRCARRWLQRTAAIRYATRRGLRREERRCNADWVRCVARIQSLWRGYCVRREMPKRLQVRQAAQHEVRLREREEYPAMVIQRAVRRFFARRALRVRWVAFYEPAAVRLQRFVRREMTRRRALGIDRATLERRDRSATRIQRTWRGYLARLAACMAALRFKLDAHRRQSSLMASQLQRVGRGMAARAVLAKWHRRYCRAPCLNAGVAEADGPTHPRRPPSARMVCTETTYLPTPVDEVAAIAALERERYHIGLFVESLAQRTRAAWEAALSVRPFDVRLRRAGEDLHCTLELQTRRRELAAVRIQREFRQWRRIRREAFRDNTLLLISRGRYQEAELGKKVEQARQRREQLMGSAIFGDQTAPMRAELEATREEWETMKLLVRTHIPAEEVRCRHERHDAEVELQRKEEQLEKNRRDDEISNRRETIIRRGIEGRSKQMLQ